MRYPVQHRAQSLAFALVLAVIAALQPPAPAAPAPERSQAAGSAVTAPVDINAASVADLEAVPGIGKALAQRIVDFRQKNGPFAKVDDLLKVQGIGEKSIEKLRPHLTVGRAK
jgi:competence protein ComEA